MRKLTSCEEAILRFLDRNTHATRRQIAHGAGISYTYTCTLLRKLIHRRLVLHERTFPRGPGRPRYNYRRPSTQK